MKKINVDVENFVGKDKKAVCFELPGDATPQDVARKVLELCGDEYVETMSIRVGIYNAGTLTGWYRGNVITSDGNPWFKVTEQKNAGVYTSIRYVF